MVDPTLTKRESARIAKLVLDSPIVSLDSPPVFSSHSDFDVSLRQFTLV